jgi:integration host factor subunit beta
VKRCNTRLGHNPRTGEVVAVGEKARPFFKAGKEMRGRLNRGGMKPSRSATTAPVPAGEA